jgi:hypothetical protein
LWYTVQVGSTSFVGLLEGTGGVSWKVLGVTFVGWIATLIIASLISAVLMVLGIRSPNLRTGKALTAAEAALASAGADATAALVDLKCPPSAALEVRSHFDRNFLSSFDCSPSCCHVHEFVCASETSPEDFYTELTQNYTSECIFHFNSRGNSRESAYICLLCEHSPGSRQTPELEFWVTRLVVYVTLWKFTA